MKNIFALSLLVLSMQVSAAGTNHLFSYDKNCTDSVAALKGHLPEKKLEILAIDLEDLDRQIKLMTDPAEDADFLLMVSNTVESTRQSLIYSLNLLNAVNPDFKTQVVFACKLENMEWTMDQQLQKEIGRALIEQDGYIPNDDTSIRENVE